MILRRYRSAKLVRQRRLRRATLENDRNLVLTRLGRMIESVDRFELMLAQLRDAAASGGAQGRSGAAGGMPGPRPAHAIAEPDARAGAAQWDAGPER